MAELLFSPVGPALFLAAAGGLLRLLTRSRRTMALSLLTTLLLGVTALLLVRLRTTGGDLRAIWWPLVISPLSVAWTLDGWNWLALLLLLLVGASSTLVVWEQPGWRTGAYHGLSLLLLGSAALSVVAENLLALSGAWVATDILLIARGRGGRPQAGRTPVSLLAGSSLLLFLAIGITSLTTSTTSLATAVLPVETQALLMLAAALRMAAYPLHLWLGPDSPVQLRGTQWLISGVGLVTGGWLSGRLDLQGTADWFAHPGWAVLLALGVSGAALAAWAGSKSDRLIFLASSRASWVWLVWLLAPPNLRQEATGWALLAATLVLGLYAVSLSVLDHWRWHIPLALSAIMLAGLPLSIGWPARALAHPQNLLVWLLIVAGEGLALASVLSEEGWLPVGLTRPASEKVDRSSISAHRRLDWTVGRLILAFGLLAVPSLLWGVWPEALARLAGFHHIITLGDFAGMASMAQIVGLLSIVVVAGLLIWMRGRLRRRVAEFEVWRSRIALLSGLGWLIPSLRLALSWLESFLRSGLDIVEGEGYLGWLALFLLLIWLVVRP